jgi:hypothetical protein
LPELEKVFQRCGKIVLTILEFSDANVLVEKFHLKIGQFRDHRFTGFEALQDQKRGAGWGSGSFLPV